ncbi:alpha-1,3-mannosyl-glycoprotein 2-beta-N-acetylglucosaminyltransferase [Nannospalax galili]|uniref:Alpha-1,3-mannosyl-glycoprotein 2-beta-N-acetylglucosaminyltransferase n=1 Tax=Nannospalax galili TaxID=1026970 RepID=A0A8C6RU82_NANGA|nr:alpha-1,3-mannosyl-glycoprotein 2-beta-N-acetylglucosaminyltransferase [Nannospalax galili]XP_008844189.1 alpha-1,3-mannosyl-glycoprotein 2-beta-N-acetylglucosaminyltransferase [Nannospalax galili]XP_008844190.1 alpha-1,3-mannosyl-glycoprotein 2-beta-N-acetylglucosaminyltransferase [Nannospalax galili]XP_017656810.1 alpha-1,3-mannosyl-glycoprotein 2-beta-N-acetylglucosaminyltransferase [Nannospalax galili]XP_029425658.1 alpha-1,3-mannosyl-glycoprotein 2-beta-N-acetylglucosaminyltransferase [
MLKKQSAGLVLWGAILFVAWNALLLLFFWTRPAPDKLLSDNAVDDDPASLTREVIRLAEDAEVELERQRALLQQIREHHALWSQRWRVPTVAPPARPHVPVTPSPAVIPILVIACDRSTVRRCLDKLLHYRPSAERFPIIVSQDCGHQETAQVIASYGNAVTHIRQPDLSNIAVQSDHRKFQGYYKIARHYRWALGQIFNKFKFPAAVVVEDDLEVAPDFFEYFQATYPLLRADPSLWCVSAWNDNGKEQMVDSSKPELLYRTDFFPGLGWLLLAELWAELEPKWPKAFWDDWMRRPEQRKGRACIRPEISRTMTFGRKGVSHGQFFDQHLKFIKLNQQFVPFTQLDLSYLQREAYDRDFLARVYDAPQLQVEKVRTNDRKELGEVRVQYTSRDSFKAFAKALGVMDDLKSGVPRAGYRGIVTFQFRGRRVHLAPPQTWEGYDPSWN